MSITLFTPKSPGLYNLSQIYNPDTPQTGEVVIPKPSSIVVDDINGGDILLVVTHVDATTYKSTMKPTRMVSSGSTDDGTLTSTISYENDFFRVYYDTRTVPTRVFVDSRLKLFGSDNATYRIVRNPGQADQVVISEYYDAGGNFTGNLVPLSRTAVGVNEWFCTNCHTTQTFEENELLELQVYNPYGALQTKVTLFAKASAILNESNGYISKITGLELRGAQQSGKNSFYLYEKQTPASLGLNAILRYDDGHERTVEFDQTKCFLFGLNDIIPAYAGMAQHFMAKYFMGASESADPALTSTRYISVEGTITVIPNELAAPVKLSVVPLWNAATAQYILRYFLYNTDRDDVKDVTGHVTIEDGAFLGNKYGTEQAFTLSLDMQGADPVKYNEATVYRQPLVIRLQPQAALERYTLRDSKSALTIFGVDSSLSRRPVLRYDDTLKQYYIPSSVFQNKEALLASFYKNANPPYLANTEPSAPTPTHFLVRDAGSGAMITAGQIPIDDYPAAFSIIGAGSANRYVGSTVVVEFVKQIDATTNLILYGVPVDVYAGNYLG